MTHICLRRTLAAVALPALLAGTAGMVPFTLAPAAIAQDKPEAKTPEANTPAEGTIAYHIKARIEAQLKRRLSKHRKAETEAILKFYEAREFKPFWFGPDGRTNAHAAALFAALNNVAEHGLDPLQYGMPKLAETISADTDTQRAANELRLTRLLIDYGGDLHSGSVAPSRTAPANYRRPVRPDTGKLLAGAETATDFGKYLSGLEPTARRYLRLKKALVRYRALEEKGGWGKIDAGPTLKPGMKDKRIAQVKKRLVVTGELAAVGAEPESYDDALVAAVKKFQERHGLEQDGKVGRNTLAEMNVPVAYRIQQIIINMERRRWLDPDLGKRYVFVNIADFELKYVESDKTRYTARVVVGRTYHKTPIFSDRIRFIRFNPYWNVPYSIASKEMLPKIKKDPGYLARNRYMLLTKPLDNSSAINPHSVDWSKIGRRNFPYYIRQKSGKGNALGTMIFMFPNPHNVFIHDTQSRSLFSREVRSFSHGCIRVQDPHKLAEILLKANGGWTVERIRKMAQKDDEVQIRLAEAVPVHITYITAWADYDGTVNFRRDIYKRDDNLIKILHRPTKAKRK